jgi:hypothetical protein
MATKCVGHKADGSLCGNWPIRGALVCGAHGGRAPQVRAKAAQRVTEEAASKTLAAILGPVGPVTDPLTELAMLAGEAKQWKVLLADRVATLVDTGYRGATGEQVRADVALFERAMDRLGTLLVAIAKLNIDERLAKIEEQRADLIADLIRAVLADDELGLTEEQAIAAPSVVVRHLRAVVA